MQDFRIELIWAKVQAAITALGGWLGSLIGVEPTSWITSILIGIGGSCLLIWIMRKLFK